jgi:uncharacterized protein (TIGR02594 family)
MSDPYWMTIARAELRRGVYEIPGPESLARIEEYQATATHWCHSNDNIPWCSSFVNWSIEGGDRTLDLVFGKTGVWEIGTKSARARSWLDWGVHVSVKHIPIGAVLIFKRGSEPQPGRHILDAKGHVCFFDGWATPNHVIGIGGNQSNMVRASIYAVSKLLDARWAA